MSNSASIPLILALMLCPQLYAQSANQVLLRNWNEIGGKLVAMAADFPEDKYGFRPVKEVRTFADHLLHVAFWNEYVAKKAAGQSMDTKADQFSRDRFKTKAAVVSELKRSFEQPAAILKSQTDEQAIKSLELWVTFIEHNGEHYGQLVGYFRLNGIVPPESRKK